MRKVIFLLFVFFVSCRQSPQNQIKISQYTVCLDSLSESFPAITHLSYVPLETTKASLINQIDKIEYCNHKIYIFDKSAMQILCFDDHGRFLNAIHNVGQGPGEYISPSDMDVDEAGNVYVFDFPSERVIKYNLGNERDFEIFDVGERALDFVVTKQSVFFSRMVRKSSFAINLASWDRQTKVLKILKENELKKKEEPSYYSSHYFYRSGSDIYYYERFHSVIYQIVDDNIEEYISFSSLKNPTLNDVRTLNQKSPEERMKSDFIKDVSACFCTKNNILVTFQAMPLIYSLIQKNTGKVYCTNSLRKFGILGFGAFAATEKDFISYCTPTQENMKYILAMGTAITGTEKEQFMGIREDDNPILIFFSFD
ncbi:MAG: 6-bladed beta-propeller [Bacteroides sp.]|jgi:hypothetical protein|nr:6-bladed beta-propeller [Bacteroides sp.]MCI1682556.1 6-bladed beta-propeller [Bacteroides sp.]